MNSRRTDTVILAIVCAASISVAAMIVLKVGATLDWQRNSDSAPCNLMVQGFQQGHFHINKELYYGVVPVLVFYWPWVIFTGFYASNLAAALLFYAVGLLASVWILAEARRHWFPAVSIRVAAGCALALGLASGLPVILQRPGTGEAAILCGFMFTMLSLAAIQRTLLRPAKGWLLAASLAFGLAVACSPSIFQPFGGEPGAGPVFSARYILTNLRIYLLAPVALGERFPFVQGIVRPALPNGYSNLECPYGVLVNAPFVWLAAGAPLALTALAGRARRACRLLLLAAGTYGLATFALLLGYWASDQRYEVEFAPCMVLMAAFGIFGLERILAEKRPLLVATRTLWVGLLAWSIGFNVLAAFQNDAEEHYDAGDMTLADGRPGDALPWLETALGLHPGAQVERMVQLDIAKALVGLGRMADAVPHYETVIRTGGDTPGIENDVGFALESIGNHGEAIAHFKRAIELHPDYPIARFNLAISLEASGQAGEAQAQLREAVRLAPNFTAATAELDRLTSQKR